ncbi:MAG: hypothetical protein EPO40_09455 [Myxococcaceae bacterium]|nr:MAG: hypothetical protein EPO40_09455 [Myxococcaceae bacterium]
MNFPLDAGLAARPVSQLKGLELPAALSASVSLLLLVSFVAGLRLDPSRLYGPVGQDAINLFVGLPLLAYSIRLARRSSLAGLLLWMGTLLHLAYSHAFYVLGTRATALLPVHAAVVAISMYALIDLLFEVDADAVKNAFGARAPSRLVGGFLAAAALMHLSWWSADLASAITAGPVSRLVEVLEPVLVMVALLGSGVLLWRRRPWGFVLAGLLLPKAALLGFTRVATAAMAALDGVAINPVQPLAFLLFGTVTLGLTARYLRSIERPAASLPALRS